MDADPFVYALLGTYLETFCKVRNPLAPIPKP